MNNDRKIQKALISVYDKSLILDIANELVSLGVEILSTGGTQQYLTSHNIPVTAVEDITGYPSIFGGRVKTLHPKVMGGILYRRDEASDLSEREKYDIPGIDLVIVDLYPFEEYVAKDAPESDIIEKIDIGGISLIRAAAKNYHDVIIVAGKESYSDLLELLKEKKGHSSIEDRRTFAAKAFLKSSNYDTHIFQYFNRKENIPAFTASETCATHLRYGENPHQKALYFGGADTLPEQLHGKEISYNNMLDIEAAVELISDFEETAVAVIKHNNACGCAVGATLKEAWESALAADPVSAFGGIIAANRTVDAATAEEMHKIFFEVVVAPDYEPEALRILEGKKNRIILRTAKARPSAVKFRSMFSGILVQDRDSFRESPADLNPVTTAQPTQKQIEDMLFANIIVKHSKSNAIVLAKDKKLIASGIGQTSRVDALKQAIEKAHNFGFSLEGAVMASDAFFPFPDCVEIADKAGIKAVIHPGGSIRDNESVEYCNAHGLAMVMTGHRHFKH
ncbi:MAG TPA: bifunctional phosphoribosylaminoimidazolecarboxamide formyltransferase/IMP cyclohydrolase [Candidatus Coprenecus stercoravium]|uniref:Bifunctional purine biosynthesis protein PurH n=1 Tax=Candidatus Coprenecus stercoravium TaxID=2840735 RepID=A0A9D2K8K6_9BACT|nr:bifunctional phosphoribosylaminoimidazolecarboxamide formyltransferase/IMP cyclohydrolase [Candidatus Coprenecus stercoravium]